MTKQQTFTIQEINEIEICKLAGNLASLSDQISVRTATIAAYALCGFANFASIGIQLGGIGSLVPEKKKELAKLVTKAMFGGALASWLTATIAGILI